MHIQIITKTFEYSNKNSIIYPLLAFKNNLNKENFFFSIIFDISKIVYSDCIIVDSKYHREDWKKNQNKIYQDFTELKKFSNKLIYFDTTDSTGMVQNEILILLMNIGNSDIKKNR